jgi:hypothetical protein
MQHDKNRWGRRRNEQEKRKRERIKRKSLPSTMYVLSAATTLNDNSLHQPSLPLPSHI